MHDPDVVAFEIRRPWPARYRNGGHRYWPALVTVWHREPGGHDSGAVCKHFRRVATGGGYRHVPVNGWRWHVHHWRVQIPFLQGLRRRLLTRCAWCGGRHRKGDHVDVSSHWRDRNGRWWQGETDLYHSDCHTVWLAHARCLCADPVFDQDGYGTCARCGKHRGWRCTPTSRDHILAGLPHGARITPDTRAHLDRVAPAAREGVG